MAGAIWVYAEVVEGAITPTTLELLTKAAEVGTAEAILLGSAPADAVETLGAFGAQKVYRGEDAIFDEFLTLPAIETVASLIESEQPAVLLSASSYAGRDLIAGLCARFDCGAISDVGDFQLKDGNVEATIPALGGSYLSTTTLVCEGPKLLLVRPKSFEPKRIGGSTATVETVSPSTDDAVRRVRVLDRVTVPV